MMQFLILGLVPGTGVQITFLQIANIIGAVIVVYLFWVLYKEERAIREEILRHIEHIESISI